MAKEPHNTEGDGKSASTDSNSAFLFADVALRGDTHRLARLLVEDLEERDNWFPSELGAMLTHQLSAPVESELFGQASHAVGAMGESVTDASRLTFRDVLFTQATSVAWLLRVKEYAKARLVRKEAQVTQRPLGRERVPHRIVKEHQGESEGREGSWRIWRIVLRPGAEVSNAGVQLHRGAEEQDVLLEERQAETLAQERQG